MVRCRPSRLHRELVAPLSRIVRAHHVDVMEVAAVVQHAWSMTAPVEKKAKEGGDKTKEFHSCWIQIYLLANAYTPHARKNTRSTENFNRKRLCWVPPCFGGPKSECSMQSMRAHLGQQQQKKKRTIIQGSKNIDFRRIHGEKPTKNPPVAMYQRGEARRRGGGVTPCTTNLASTGIPWRGATGLARWSRPRLAT